jgi:hypothetical protein
MSIDSGDTVAVERRKAAGRRKKDQEMESKIKALADSHAKIFEALQKQGDALREQSNEIKYHIVDCSENYVGLKRTVDVIQAYVEPKIRSAQAWGEIVSTVKKAVITDTMVAVIKWGAIFTVASLFLGSNPAVKKFIEFIAARGLP